MTLQEKLTTIAHNIPLVYEAGRTAGSDGGKKLYRHDIQIYHGMGAFLLDCRYTIFNTDPTNYSKDGVTWTEDGYDIDYDNSYFLTAADVPFIPTHAIPAVGVISTSAGNDGAPIVTIRRDEEFVYFGQVMYQSDYGEFWVDDYIREYLIFAGDQTDTFRISSIEQIIDTVTEVM